jgi:hypothetical protein
MAWSIRFGGSGGTTISSATATGKGELTFIPQCTRVVNEKGRTEGIDWAFDIDGDISADSAELVTEAMIDVLIAQITEQGARQVEFILDGTVKLSLTPAGCFWGPFVMDVRARPDEGNGAGHWRWTMRVTARQKVTPGYNLKTSLQIDKNTKGEVVRKIWEASCQAKTADLAVSVLLAFKPSGFAVLESIKREFEDPCGAFARWEWLPEQKQSDILIWRCKAEIQGGAGIVEDKQVGNEKDGFLAEPKFHLKRLGLTRVIVTGSLETRNPAFTAPPAHYTEDENMFRATEEERNQEEPVAHNVEKGTYTFEYTEVWYAKNVAKVPKASHSDNHHLIDMKTPPSDGGMA